MSIWYSASQPWLFPPLFIVERWCRVQHWVVMEETQFERRNVQIELMSKAGPIKISPQFKDPNRKAFEELYIDKPEAWLVKLGNAVQMTYGKQEAYRKLKPSWDALLSEMAHSAKLLSHCRLADDWVREQLSIPVLFHSSKSLVPIRPENPVQWIADFSTYFGAKHYVQGAVGMHSYIAPQRKYFDKYGVKLWAQNFAPVASEARIGFSVLDSLFTLGKIRTREAVYANAGWGNKVNTMVEVVP